MNTRILRIHVVESAPRATFILMDDIMAIRPLEYEGAEGEERWGARVCCQARYYDCVDSAAVLGAKWERGRK